MDINYSVGKILHVEDCSEMLVPGDAQMESNHRYYFRRAAEERMAAQRAMTENAREWHAKLAQQFAARASAECSGSAMVATA